MPAARLSSRIDTLEIKVEIQKRIGQVKATKYFSLLTRFLSLRISKVEFDKQCMTTIGKQNLYLHNHLIRSILKNACIGKDTPLLERSSEVVFGDKLINGYQRSCLQSLSKCFPQQRRTPTLRDHRSKDHPSPLGPKGKGIDSADSEDIVSVIEEEGNKDLQEVEGAFEGPRVVLTPIAAPLGIPQYSKQKSGSLWNGVLDIVSNETCCSSGELPDTDLLMKRLQKKLEINGLKNISMDSANLLNKALDVHLKRLIRPCLELAGSKTTTDLTDQRQRGATSDVCGMPKSYFSRPKSNLVASYSDFRAAMELNPSILGPDWPLQLEKVCLRTSEDLN